MRFIPKYTHCFQNYQSFILTSNLCLKGRYFAAHVSQFTTHLALTSLLYTLSVQ